MKRPKRLSATFVRLVKEPGRYGDGFGSHGLSLLVREGSSGLRKTWAQRLRIGGRPVNVGLGSYPIVTLAEAREAALENARAVHRGEDPRVQAAVVPTFAEAVERVIALHAPTFRSARTAQIFESVLRDYAIPRFGKKLVSEVTTADVLAVLTPIWTEKRETARRVRQRIGTVMRWAVAEGHREDNPAGEAIRAALPQNGGKAQHQRSLPHAEVAGALAKVRGSQAWPGTQLAFEFLLMTAARSGEVRFATWTEIDLEARTWTVPADRTKTGTEHRVPLSDAALAVLERARELDGTGLIFPSPRGRVLSDNTLSKLLRELEVKGTPHGFRSSFRDWAAEATDADHAVMEISLGHAVGSQVERAYARSDLFARRRALMNQWAAYLAG